MKYILLSNLYWPVWIVLKFEGYDWWSILIASVVTFAALTVAWRLEFGTLVLGK